jgi:hypothetical protein
MENAKKPLFNIQVKNDIKTYKINTLSLVIEKLLY